MEYGWYDEMERCFVPASQQDMHLHSVYVDRIVDLVIGSLSEKMALEVGSKFILENTMTFTFYRYKDHFDVTWRFRIWENKFVYRIQDTLSINCPERD